MSGIELGNVVKAYGDIKVIHGIDLTVEDGEFCVLVGPSGCGKSTLLRMIAGLEETTGGSIRIGDRDVTHEDPSKRGVSMVFQSYALYPHMTVAENIGFGLKVNRVKKTEIVKKVAEAAKVLQLEELLDRKPKALSGGQRQRVAIGRAIVRGPEVFLFDEPLSNLDAELRVDMRVEIARLHQEMNVTMVYVTHDQVEAMTLADKIVVLRDGRIEQIGTPTDLYSDPDNKFVAGFIGSPRMNFLEGRLQSGRLNIEEIEGMEIVADISSQLSQEDVIVGIRPQQLTCTASPDGNFSVDLVENLGGVSYAYLKTKSGTRIVVEVTEGNVPDAGASVEISFDGSVVKLFDPKTDNRIR